MRQNGFYPPFLAKPNRVKRGERRKLRGERKLKDWRKNGRDDG